MPAQKKTIKVLMFLLPAIVSLLAYTAFHEMLFRKPPCLINCDQPGLFSDNEKLKKWLAFLESLRDDPFNTKPSNKRTSPTPLDIAFLQDKINVARNDKDYLTRYQQIISDLTSPYVTEESDTGTSEKGGLTDEMTPLVYLKEDETPNNPILWINPDTNPSPIGPGPFVIPDPEEEPKSPTPPITVPGSSNGNPVSSVPAPKSAYLVLGLLVAIGAIRFRVIQRKNILRF